MKTCIYFVLFFFCLPLLPACQSTAANNAAATEAAFQAAATQTPKAPTATPPPTTTLTTTPSPTPTNTPTITPSPTPAPDPIKILNTALKNLRQAESYELAYETQINVAMEGISADLAFSYEGWYQAPNRSQGTMIINMFGEKTNQDVVVFNGISYHKHPEAKVWMVSSEPMDGMSEGILWDLEASNFQELSFVGLETLETQPVIHLQGTITDIKNAMDPVSWNTWQEMNFNLTDDSQINADFWIRADDYMPLKSTSSGDLFGTLPLDSQQVRAISLSLNGSTTFSDFGSSIVIAKPETPKGTILYVTSDNVQNDVYTIEADSSGQTLVLTSPWRKLGAAWSPDGSQIVYSEYSVNDDLFVRPLDAATEKQITNLASNEVFPEWSPDGTKISFDSNQTGNWDVYVMDADGSNVINITNHPATYDIFSAWSPDGEKIAFGSNRDGVEHIYVVDADGSNLFQLTNNPIRNDGYPTWSPDGTKIAFSGAYESPADYDFELYVIDADGENERQLTDNLFNDAFPDWSPDGTRIAFSSNPEGDYDIWVINVDGTNLSQLTYDLTEDLYPKWRPCLDDCPTTD